MKIAHFEDNWSDIHLFRYYNDHLFGITAKMTFIFKGGAGESFSSTADFLPC